MSFSYAYNSMKIPDTVNPFPLAGTNGFFNDFRTFGDALNIKL